MDRRQFLTATATAGTLGLGACATRQMPEQPAGLFALGVASGEPEPDGFVIWTRLTRAPLSGGGMGRAPVTVGWEVAEDAQFQRIVGHGRAKAQAHSAHAIHVDVARLKPNRWYWYRFHALGEVSPVGRSRTTPAPENATTPLTFAFASCQHYEHGYFGGYRHLIADRPDIIFFLGDYIYETNSRKPPVRRHAGPECRTLADYRNRYAQYKLDPDLQAAHAAAPWVVTWDDHEVENDYAGDKSGKGDPVAQFLQRRAAAYQAYYEHMPLRRSAAPNASAANIYRRFRWGALLNTFILDTRQYRSDQACGKRGRWGGQVIADCAERLDRRRTKLGWRQEQWLHHSLSGSRARWNMIAQQTLMAQFRQRTRDGRMGFWSDGWDGYPAARARLLRHIEQSRVRNPLVIGGDIHSFWATALKANFGGPAGRTVASEFVGTSMTSRGIPASIIKHAKTDNPHVLLAESRYRGYGLGRLTPTECRIDFRALTSVATRQSGVQLLASYVVPNGRPGPVLV
jgi:alkaline phosphatase D